MMAPEAEPQRVTDAYDIGEILFKLAENGDAMALYPADGSAPRMGRIKSVADESDDFIMEMNEPVHLPRGAVTFVAWLVSAKIQFTLEADWCGMADDPKNMFCVFPAECLVLERRATERLEAPLGVNYTASMVIGRENYELQLYDISEGGIGMRATSRETVGLYVGRKLQRVRLDLGPSKAIMVDLEIRLTRTFRSFLSGEQVQIGCSFINLTPGVKAEVKEFVDSLQHARKR